MDPNENVKMNDQHEVEHLIERFAPKLAAEESKTLSVLVLGEDNGPSLRFLEAVRDIGRERGLDLIVHTAHVELIQEPKSDPRRMALVDTGRVSFAKAIAAVMRDIAHMDVAAEVPEEVGVLQQPQVMSFQQKAKGSSFRQFQSNKRAHGPSQRKQFAQIRPPRRGGR